MSDEVWMIEEREIEPPGRKFRPGPEGFREDKERAFARRNWLTEKLPLDREGTEWRVQRWVSEEELERQKEEARRAGRAEAFEEIRERVLELGNHHYKNVEHTGAAMRLLAGNLEALAAKEREP